MRAISGEENSASEIGTIAPLRGLIIIYYLFDLRPNSLVW